MSPNTTTRHFSLRVTSSLLLLLLQVLQNSFALNSDGICLLSFKYLILSDPLSALENWNYNDQTPCSWNGVTCSELGPPGTPDMFRVTSLVLPNTQLLGSISPDLGKIEHLRQLDLSNNFFNGSLPLSIFNATELWVLSLSGNVISGQLPDSISGLRSLQLLNLSDNAFAGKLPETLAYLRNLTVLSLRSNYFSGNVPFGFNGSLEVLDLSSNLLNGSLPLDLGGENLRYLNLSYNKISGKIPPEFAKKIPQNSTIDLSFNNLTGAIPESESLLSQKKEFFSGNSDLCGKPLKNLCTIPSSISTPPNVSTTSSPAIAVIPKTIDSNSNQSANSSTQSPTQRGLRPGTIAGIAIADLAGIVILTMVILYVYQVRKRKTELDPEKRGEEKQDDSMKWTCLLGNKGGDTSEGTSSDSDREAASGGIGGGGDRKKGVLVTVDGERPELELERLLKASAYVLGASGESIVYKALMEDGTAMAVRRIGRSQGERKRDFESHVRYVAKLRHPNLVKVRGFYWGEDEKLVVCDYVSNGSLASSGSRRAGSSPLHQPLEVRFKIARGIAKGLTYIHEKKHVHGNIKPSNILLNSDMEPIISDFGLGRLVSGNIISNHKESGSSRYFASLRATTAPTTTARESQLDVPIGGSPVGSSTTAISPYQAPESLKNLKPSSKWDVFSFGIILLELLTSRVFSDRELGLWTAGFVAEDKNRVLRLVDVAIRAEVESREDAVLACLKLGFNCASLAPQKRPTMKEALQVLDKIPSIS